MNASLARRQGDGMCEVILRGIFLLVLCLELFASPGARAEGDCGIVYGEDWAFAFAAPDRWRVLCDPPEFPAAAIALWPAGDTFAKALAVMYVTVNDKDTLTLSSFVEDEQHRFREEAPDVRIDPVDAEPIGGNGNALVFQLSGDPGHNHELIAYVDGPTKFFILVVSARSLEALNNSREAFISLLRSFVPMSARTSP